MRTDCRRFWVLTGCGANNAGASRAVVTAPLKADPQRLRGYWHVLADDVAEAREAGTRGYQLAAAFVASQFAAFGLVPGGDQARWLQEEPLLRSTPPHEGTEFSIYYHQPSDPVDLPINYESAIKIADINHRIGLAVGNDANPPRRNEGDSLVNALPVVSESFGFGSAAQCAI